MATRFYCVGVCVAVMAAALAVAAPQPAAAQNVFQRIFGGLFHSPAPGQAPGQPPAEARAFDNPFTALARAIDPPRREDSSTGPATAFCVRTCDGFHFQVRANAGASTAQMCHAFCPGSDTRLYVGSNIDYATTNDGSRYADLGTAHEYQKQLVAGCTCNGRNPFGLAHIDVDTDPTLRPGDVVATKNGLMAVTGTKDKTAEFSPAVSYPRFSKAYREELSAMRIAPPALERPDGVPMSSPAVAAQPNDSRSAQR